MLAIKLFSRNIADNTAITDRKERGMARALSEGAVTTNPALEVPHHQSAAQ